MCAKCENPNFTVHSLTSSLRCDECNLTQYAVHVDKIGKNSGAVAEIVCIGCLKQTKLDISGSIGGKAITGLMCGKCKGKTRLEAGAVIDRRGEFINKNSKRIINDG